MNESRNSSLVSIVKYQVLVQRNRTRDVVKKLTNRIVIDTMMFTCFDSSVAFLAGAAMGRAATEIDIPGSIW